MNLHITWPIEDPHQTLTQLRDEARADLAQTLRHHHLQPRGKTVWNINHGAHPTIHARTPVRLWHQIEQQGKSDAA